MHGNLYEITVNDLIQYHHQHRKTAQIIVKHEEKQATLFFTEGQLSHAEMDHLQGEEVVYEVLSWKWGQFYLEAEQNSAKRTIHRSCTNLLSEAKHRQNSSNAHKNNSVSNQRRKSMAKAVKEALQKVMEIEGTMGAALVDWKSGMTLETIGSSADIEVAASGHTNVVRAKLKLMELLEVDDQIEDILICLREQYHIIRLLRANPELFIYVVLNRATANLGMARYKLGRIEEKLHF